MYRLHLENDFIMFYQLNRFHREDGPVLVYVSGHKEWRINGVRHRDDGPAIEYRTGTKVWFEHGDVIKMEES